MFISSVLAQVFVLIQSFILDCLSQERSGSHRFKVAQTHVYGFTAKSPASKTIARAVNSREDLLHLGLIES
jgi:hypothetical protein